MLNDLGLSNRLYLPAKIGGPYESYANAGENIEQNKRGAMGFA